MKAMSFAAAALLALPLVPAAPARAASAPAEASVKDAAGAPTFTRDVAPIVLEKCAGCHRPDGSGPFPLRAHSDFAARAPQIAEVVESGYMPPWLAEPGPDYENERRLSEAERRTLLDWITAGAPEGPKQDVKAAPGPESGWVLGEPDLVLKMPEPYELPADGPDVFRGFVLPVGIDAPKLVRAVEIRPGSASAAHHAYLYVDTTGSIQHLDKRDPGPGYEGLSLGNAAMPAGDLLGWLPGKQPFAGHADIAWQLEPGSDLLLQLHLVPTGKPERIQAQVGIHYADAPPSRFPLLLQLGPQYISIPAGEASHVLRDDYVLPVPVYLLSVQPHAHALAKRLEAWADTPEGERIALLKIEDWDPRFQDAYRFREPILLPPGTALSLRYTYDNSASNPHNPSQPPKRVGYGWRSGEEMCEMWFLVVPLRAEGHATLAKDFTQTRIDKDFATYQKATQAEPENVLYQRDLAKAYFRAGRFSEAERSFSVALRFGPDDIDTNWLLARLYEVTKQSEMAMDQYRRVLELDPEHKGALESLAAKLIGNSRTPDAMPLMERLAVVDPKNVPVRLGLADQYARRGEAERAVQYLKEAVAIDPRSAEARFDLASLYAKQGKVAEAYAEFVALLGLNPKSPEANYYVGIVSEKQGQLEKARDHYAAVLEVKPDYEPAKKQLAALELKLAAGK